MACYKSSRQTTLAHRSDERLAILVAKKILPKYSHKSILDIGCGDGIVGDHLDARVAYQGLDIVNACIYQQQHNNPKVKYIEPSMIKDYAIAQGPWDTVLLLDVLEHTRSFTDLFDTALANSQRVVVSLPNELFILDRLKMLLGRELNAHSLDLLKMPEGFKHQYIINIGKARAVLCKVAAQRGFKLSEEVQRPLISKHVLARPVYRLLRMVFDAELWSMGSIFVFEHN